METQISKNLAGKLLVVGSSWHASVLIDAIESAASFTIAGYLDDTIPVGTVRRGYPILGGLKDLERICSQYSLSQAALAIGDNWWRRKVHADIGATSPGLAFPIIRHPSATVARSAQIGKGTVILAGANVGPSSCVGDFCILNTMSSIDHDCTMAGFSSMAPGATAGGLAKIGECSAIGVGASISDRVSIGRHSVVGTGASVVRDVPDLVIAYGNPARKQRTRAEGERYVDCQKESE